ncbi:MAG: TetR/AcrR family transcriptional regulator [Roseibium sp.]
MNRNVHGTGHISPVKSSDVKPIRGGHPTGRISKQQWLEAALDALVAGGVEAVRIVDIAKTLKISKSGFYWHFKGRKDLMDEMKRYWMEEFSQQIISETLHSNAPIFEKMSQLVRMIRERGAGKYDLAFTSWAVHDPSIRKLVDDVRDMRIAFVKKLLALEGYTGDDLEARARLFVVYFSWSEVMFKKTETCLEGEPLDEVMRLISDPRAR